MKSIPKKFQKLINAHSTLGSFNPQNLLIHFQWNDKDVNIETLPNEPQKILERIPTYLIAHELSHFFQSTATTYGIRNLFFSIDSLTLKLEIIKKYVEQNNGNLPFPIIAKVPNGNRDIASKITQYTQLVSKRLYHSGGWHLDRAILKKAKNLYGPLYFIKYPLWGNNVSLLLVDLKQFNNTNRISVVGGHHLCEGSSKAIDMIQARLTGEGYISAYHPSDYSHKPIGSKDHPDLFDPYFLTNTFYSLSVNSCKGCEDESSLEEFVAISDLALMCDNWIINLENYFDFENNEFLINLKELDKLDFSPSSNYFHFLQTFTANWKNFTRIKENCSQMDVVRFQNELLLSSGGMPLSCIMERVESFFLNFFPIYKERCPISLKILDYFYIVFSKTLRFRREVLKDGALLIDLLTSDKDLHNFFLNFVPSFMFGSSIWSSIEGYHTGIGIGVELERLRHLHEITDIILLGDDTCSHIKEKPNICCAKKSLKCKSILNIKAAKPKCVREEALFLLTEMFNIKKIKKIV